MRQRGSFMSPALIQMLVGAVMISTSAPWVRVAETPPSVSGFYRMLIGGVVMLMWLLITRQRITSGFRAALVLIPVAAFFAADLFFWHRSIHYIGPGLATILANFQVFILAAVGMMFFGEKIGWWFAGGLALAFAGIYLLVGTDWSSLSAQYQIGVWFGLATAVAYSLFILGMRWSQTKAGAQQPMPTLAVMSLFCAAIMAMVVAAEGHSFAIPNLETGLALGAYGVFCQVIGWLLITRAMPHLPASLVGLILLLQPALSFLWDILFFARPTGHWDLLGVGLVLAGIYLASEEKRRTNVSL